MRANPQIPLTVAGWTIVGVTLTCGALALALSWLELGMLAIGGAVALAVCVPFVLGISDLDLQRTLEPAHVEVGGEAVAHLTITGRSWAPTPAQTVVEMIDGQPHLLRLPALSVANDHKSSYRLPTNRRGVFTIGPAYATRSDPFGLMQRDVGHSSTATLRVHPRVRPVASLAAGFVKDLEGPTFDTSPAGDIAFHTVREYSFGDDIRHVHWMSTARAGSLMVRHYVDNRLATVVTLVDDRKAGFCLLYTSPSPRDRG